jgi:hypothetical protein
VAYLLDTDILIDLGRGTREAGRYADSLGEWSISIVSGMELLGGAKDARDAREIDFMIAAYGAIQVSEDISRLGYNLMKSYSKSHGLDPADALIAATALHQGLTLATRNRKHFSAIAGLEVEVPGYP